MGFFDEQTRRVELPGDNWAIIRRLTYGDRQSAMGVSSQIDVTTQRWTVNPATLRVEELIRSVSEWGGPDLDGVPANRENVLRLPDQVGYTLQRAQQDLQAEVGGDSGLKNGSGKPTNGE